MRGRVEDLIHIGVVSHHLISFTQEALAGRGGACFYADPSWAAALGIDPIDDR
ncbi:MAG: hypothetical protein M3294_08375 [Pseudomonadota bacterium]|nr:hypothetical protein [Pseudomonadota bacterium]